MLIFKNQNEEYGYVPSNPVLLNSYADIQHFFGELHTEKGCTVTYRRIGSTFEAQSNHMIDVFEVSGDNGNKLLYLDVFNIKGCYFAAHSTVHFTASSNNSGIYAM